MVSDQHNDSILILDFGSQVTQLIARRVRESGIYSEIFPFSKADEAIKKLKPKGIILSGGPASVNNQDAPTIDDKIFDLKIPILGICYGQQIMCSLLGGEVEKSNKREFGRANIKFLKSSPLFEGFDIKENTEPVWMSHGTNDSTSSYDMAAQMAENLSNLGSEIEFQSVVGGEHGGYLDIYNNPEIMQWILSHVRGQ